MADRNIEATPFWIAFRRASRRAPEQIQEAMVELADTGTCQLDERHSPEFQRILSTLPAAIANPITRLPPPVRPRFGY